MISLPYLLAGMAVAAVVIGLCALAELAEPYDYPEPDPNPAGTAERSGGTP